MTEEVSVSEVGKFALKVYKICRDCPGQEFSSLAPQIRTIHYTLQDLEDHLEENSISSQRNSQLLENLRSIRSVLHDTESHVKEYNALPPATRSSWARLNWQDQHIREDAKARLSDAVVKIEQFYEATVKSKEATVEKALDQLINQDDERSLQKLRKISEDSVERAWIDLVDELELMGIERAVSTDCRDLILEWIKRAKEDKRLSPSSEMTEESDASPGNIPYSHPSGTRNTSGNSNAVVISPPTISQGNRLQEEVQIASTAVSAPTPLKSVQEHSEHKPRPVQATVPITPSEMPKQSDLYSSTHLPRSPVNLAETPTAQIEEATEKTRLSPTTSIAQGAGNTNVALSIQGGTWESASVTPDLTGGADKILFFSGPPLPPKINPQQQPEPTRTDSNLSLSGTAIQEEPAVSVSDNEAPSPAQEEPRTDMRHTARQIATAWNLREWSKAYDYLQLQIRAVERGEFTESNGVPVQPHPGLLRHLQGVCCSYQGDFIRAKAIFQLALQHADKRPLDSCDVAAARWLGDTCIYINEPANAALAWAIALSALLQQGNTHSPHTKAISHDLRQLNQYTNSLTLLHTHSMSFNRDISTILRQLPASWKFAVILEAREHCYKNLPTEVNLDYQFKDIKISEGFLVQPLLNQQSHPMFWDPYFRASNSTHLLVLLSKPKILWAAQNIPTVSLGRAESLVYTTKRDAQWLIDTVMEALNMHAIEWKVVEQNFAAGWDVPGTSYLIRLSQTHDRIAYYECYAIKIRKVRMRKEYGVKISGAVFTTRTFIPANHPTEAQVTWDQQRQAAIRSELANRLKLFLGERERELNDGTFQQPNATELSEENARYELPAVATLTPELPASTNPPVELEGRRIWSWKKKGNRTSEIPAGVYELPAER